MVVCNYYSLVHTQDETVLSIPCYAVGLSKDVGISMIMT